VTGTIVKASRRQIGILILWDGAARPSDSRHDRCVNPADDAIDMLNGFGVRAGMRVESLPEDRFRLTGDVVQVEPTEEHRAPSSDKSAKQLHAAAMRGTNQDRIDEYLRTQGPPRDPDTDEELLYGR
jgi:hypothetical protein